MSLFTATVRSALGAALMLAAGAAAAWAFSTDVEPTRNPTVDTSGIESGALAPTDWRPFGGLHYRLTAGGDVSCYSEDGLRCSIAVPDPAKARPIDCGSLQVRPAWGEPQPAYQTVDHWCNIAHANLFAKWANYKPLGYPVVLATNPRGDVMCKSLDGVVCLKPGQHRESGAMPLKPLVCGHPLSRRIGISGYADPAHWCSSPEIVVREKDPDAPGPRIDLANGSIERVFKIPLGGWTAAQRPTWIVRLQVPRPERSGAKLAIEGLTGNWREASYSAPPEGWSREAALNAAGTLPLFIRDFHKAQTASRRWILDKKGRGVLAIRVEDGVLRFFQAPGWPAHHALAMFDLDPRKEWVHWNDDKWTASESAVVTITTRLRPPGGGRPFHESDLRDPPLPVVKEFVMTRQRPPPRPLPSP
ncbi:hypothetical protein [Roseateles sp. L2-2]|uniref:hypothetical protein n=1 Tax=Roseateles sp. L2-2 TaxID=3422597 RepID=UPI003D36B15F